MAVRKFKIGDKVRIIKRHPMNHTGLQDWQLPNGDVGKEGFVKEYWTDEYVVDDPKSLFYLGIFEEDEIELVNKRKVASKKTVKKVAKNKITPKKKKPMAMTTGSYGSGSMGLFDTGDRVVLMSGRYSDSPSNPRWGGSYGSITGTVVQLLDRGNVAVSWDNGRSNGYHMGDLTPFSQVAGSMGVTASGKPIKQGKELDLSQLDSIIIEDSIKAEITSVLKQHKNGKKLFEEWGLGEVIEYGKGMTFMFYGPPGTGKTGMARCIAKAVGNELLVISAAEIQSSEPGAANRNIQNAFQEAKETGKVLFLDECDSLITSRNDLGMVLAGEVNTLLTEIEKYEGVLVLATNRIEHMDEALERRISLIVEFAPPNFEARKQIWGKLIPKKMPVAKDVNTDVLAIREITGGQIKNVVLAAARLALANEDKEVTLQHFTSAMDRVCASKNLMGAASRYRQGVISDVHAHVTKGRSVDVGIDKKRTVDAFLDEQLKEEEGV